MSSDTLIALMSFTLVVSISPGPGNLMLLSSGASFGFRRSIPLVLGICLGFMSLILLVGVGMEHVFTVYPALYTVLKLVCVIYVVKLAWKIARSALPIAEGPAPSEASTSANLASPISLFQGAALQLVSPKAWALTPILTVSYTNPDNYLTSLLLMIPVCAAVNIPSTSVWALFGVTLRQILLIGRRAVYFNYFMAALLLCSMLPVLS